MVCLGFEPEALGLNVADESIELKCLQFHIPCRYAFTSNAQLFKCIMFVSNNCHLLPLFIFIISLQNQSVDVTSCYMITRSFLKLLYKLPNFIYYNSLLNLLLSSAHLEFLSSTPAIVLTLVHPLAANASTSQFS